MCEEKCEPFQIEPETRHYSADYNCNRCSQTDCFYWVLYHPIEVKEQERMKKIRQKRSKGKEGKV